MFATGYRFWVVGTLFSLMLGNAEAAPGDTVALRLSSVAVASDGRSGWDAVGRAEPEHLAAAVSAAGRPVSAAAEHQARKREMVRRMFLLMVAYR